MGPHDCSAISRNVISAILNPRMDTKHLPEFGLTLPDLLEKGMDQMPKLVACATRYKLFHALHKHTSGLEQAGQVVSALQELAWLKEAITFALVSPIGSLFGAETVEPHSTNPFSTVTASLVNEELRRIYQELHLECLNTPAEDLLEEVMAHSTNVIRADQRQLHVHLCTEAARGR